jgi:hypothetical protein
MSFFWHKKSDEGWRCVDGKWNKAEEAWCPIVLFLKKEGLEGTFFDKIE